MDETRSDTAASAPAEDSDRHEGAWLGAHLRDARARARDSVIRVRGARQNNLRNLSLDIRTNELVVVTGVSIDEHRARLETVRNRFLEHISQFTEDDMNRPRELPDWGYAISPEWTLHHLMQHEAEHRGEIVTIRTLYAAQS